MTKPAPSEPSERSILVVGSTMIDLVAFAPRLPDAGETVVGDRFLQGFGGKGANQAVMAARFGLPVAIVATVGDDANGQAIRENLVAQRVDVADVTTAAGTSGVAPIWVDGAGMNRIIVIAGTNRLVPPDRAADAVRRRRPTVVLGQFEIPQPTTAAAFAAARDVGAVTLLNPAPGEPILPALLATTDWLIPNESEFVAIGGRPLSGDVDDEDRAIDELGTRLGVALVVTLGERGVAVRPDAGAVVRISAPAVAVVDSTGAGDAFVGAFAVGLARGLDPAAAARLGCDVAADAVTRPGTQSSFASSDAALGMLADARRTMSRP